jgi:hypothetical protein
MCSATLKKAVFCTIPRVNHSREAGGVPGLEAEPAVLTGALIGYARVSTRDQNLHRQIDQLTAAGCLRIFSDKRSGKDTARAELAKALDFMRPGDTLVVAALDRLSRSLQDLITMVADLGRRGIGFKSLHESLDTPPKAGSSSTCSPRSPNSSGNSSSRARARAWRPPGSAAGSADGRQ